MSKKSVPPPPAKRHSSAPPASKERRSTIPPPPTLHTDRMESVAENILPTSELAKLCAIFARIDIINTLIPNGTGQALPVAISRNKKPKEGKIDSL